MREYHYEIQYVNGKYNYVADQLSRPVRTIQRNSITTLLGLTPEEFKTCQREEVKWREMIEYLEGGSFLTKKYHKTILQQFTVIYGMLYFAKEKSDGCIQYTLVDPHSQNKKLYYKPMKLQDIWDRRKLSKKLKNYFTVAI